ncbi:bifunctional methylenetetrahydrofolate dehydrogenase/methenyltetrahydrofolate cyclohydrolase FolD [Hydrocarboniclastica marina]|uniref:Bifunctional protein FolD n=1 Tax=Hydrocarboniclastica marina TaxID=2259620 RepID=A0A4P7XFC4_9ALTE|nr:bifunctional methylenetetrahydrofolate dehydrogenase/methenyltetrahydrofolate cyclohydrolase FolD [Hydrocarboniclastica marina]MAL98639.1 bifunctional methylenetetrahydrofolate dehydrogenase/methenyltetrahydrofolate cyclohydrolase FolD [Alteromonadaceae bacterium]QCF25616.1 bifunctional methylenetetrahydrofolate dehydrogenase/methenyltetrahydrofolate cyclohydrolase FolD [Hydrocarboniclastica marina]|tara:strand:- start:487 stop:1344 length:858 start_codon:yes stop_codon:yes gene_type:complete
MTAKLIDGRQVSATVREEVSARVKKRLQDGKRAPGLAVVLVGEDPASQIYVRNKRRDCESVGFASFQYDLGADATQVQLESLIDDLNDNPEVDGILIQLPLPPHLDADPLLLRIHPDKDVDGFHPYNLGRLCQRKPELRPCTPAGIIRLLDSIGTNYKGAHALVVGASNIVGRPMALELLLKGATITVAHRFTQDLAGYVAQADILVAAAGKPGLIKGEWVKPGSTVIDVGMNRLDSGKLCGDVEFDAARERAAWITPVPGGVGPMTIATLLQNALEACERRDIG